MTKITEEEKDEIIDWIDNIEKMIVESYNEAPLTVLLARGLSWRIEVLNKIRKIINSYGNE